MIWLRLVSLGLGARAVQLPQKPNPSFRLGQEWYEEPHLLGTLSAIDLETEFGNGEVEDSARYKVTVELEPQQRHLTIVPKDERGD